MSQIERSLLQLFSRHEWVFWQDTYNENWTIFDELALPAVEKLRVEGNEFGIKVRLHRELAGRKVLFYRTGPRPDDPENWLLDVELAAAPFEADQLVLWLMEMGLGLELRQLMAPYTDFLRQSERRLRFAELFSEHAPPGLPPPLELLQRLMMAAILRCNPALPALLLALLTEYVDERNERLLQLEQSGLAAPLWQAVRTAYGYESSAPSPEDVTLQLFQSGFARQMGRPQAARLNAEALALLNQWQDSIASRAIFAKLSARSFDALNLDAELAVAAPPALMGLTLFEATERHLLARLVQELVSGSRLPDTLLTMVERRRQSPWQPLFANHYDALAAACRFFELLAKLDLALLALPAADNRPAASANDRLLKGMERYAASWHLVDQYYRTFIHAQRSAATPDLFTTLLEKLENAYQQQWMQALANHWQPLLERIDHWPPPGMPSQRTFFRDQVQTLVNERKKVAVLISDGLRYEIAAELQTRIHGVDRYEATIKPVVGVLPAFTQLGMAALLPHTTLLVKTDGTVEADDRSTVGLENRRTILAGTPGLTATALSLDEFMQNTREESRRLLVENDVLYLYHNNIDARGDKLVTEEEVFAAAAETIDTLLHAVKKLAGANFSYMVVTTDHGFLYQQRELGATDFQSDGPAAAGAKINRRFVNGQNLPRPAGYRYFTAAQLGLAGEQEFLFPAGLTRLRQMGSGSRYVHGGPMPQEIVLPVVQIVKRRQDNLSPVAVEILGGGVTITTNQQVVRFYQVDAATPKQPGRTLRAGFQAGDNTVISDVHELHFDSGSDNARDREKTVTFTFTHEASRFDGQEIRLVLTEQVGASMVYNVFAAQTYQLRRRILPDF